jgi:hypothetical protein
MGIPSQRTGGSSRRRLVVPAAVSTVLAACLAATAMTTAGGTPEPHASRPATVAILGTGALSMALLAAAALTRLFRPRAADAGPPSRWPERAVRVALAVLLAGLVTGVAIAVLGGNREGSAGAAGIALWSAAIVALVVLLHHRWIRRLLW